MTGVSHVLQPASTGAVTGRASAAFCPGVLASVDGGGLGVGATLVGGALEAAVRAGVAVAGCAVTAPLYMSTPVRCTLATDSRTPLTVVWWPAVSVSRTVNGPPPAPLSSSQ